MYICIYVYTSLSLSLYIYIYMHALFSTSNPSTPRSAGRPNSRDLRRGWFQRGCLQQICDCKLCLRCNSAVCHVALSSNYHFETTPYASIMRVPKYYDRSVGHGCYVHYTYIYIYIYVYRPTSGLRSARSNPPSEEQRRGLRAESLQRAAYYSYHSYQYYYYHHYYYDDYHYYYHYQYYCYHYNYSLGKVQGAARGLNDDPEAVERPRQYPSLSRIPRRSRKTGLV